MSIRANVGIKRRLWIGSAAGQSYKLASISKIKNSEKPRSALGAAVKRFGAWR
jgi:hypothetical protein